ncbi:hypothetical protein JTB14_002250 [Gonioctena quinquepunctata]|nr:hypothetical protein JTB14_002250 [Gonioctena quinquepunctata]
MGIEQPGAKGDTMSTIDTGMSTIGDFTDSRLKMPSVQNKIILNYGENQILSAVGDVQKGMPVATAAKKHGVPVITLLYKAKGKTPMNRQMGGDSYLTKYEKNLVGE